MAEISKAENLREEFNRWAEAGRGEGMEQDHLPITLPVLEKMRIAPTDNILDVGCGAGWLSRRLAKLEPEGRVNLVELTGSDFDFSALNEVDEGVREDILEELEPEEVAEIGRASCRERVFRVV